MKRQQFANILLKIKQYRMSNVPLIEYGMNELYLLFIYLNYFKKYD